MNTLRTNKDVLRSLVLGIIILVIFVCLAVADIRLDNSADASYGSGAYDYDFSREWTSEETGDIVNIEDVKFSEADGEKEFVFYKTLPELTGKEHFCLQSKNMSFKVVEKKFASSYTAFEFDGRGSGIGGNASGNHIHTMQLYKSDTDNTFYLILKPIYKSSAVFNVRIQDPDSYTRACIRATLPSFLSSVIMIVAAISVFIMATFLDGEVNKRIYMSLAIVVVLVGLMSLLDSHFIEYVMGKSDLVHTINYFTLMLAAFPFLMFSDAVTIKPHKNLSGYAWLAVIGMMAFQAFMNYSHIADFHNMTVLTNLMTILSGVIVGARLIEDWKFRKDNDLHIEDSGVTYGLAILSVCGVLDSLRYLGFYSIHGLRDNTLLIRVGLLFFVFGILFNIYNEVVNSNKRANAAGVYMEMAYTDPLTGIPNRGAFEGMEKEMSMQREHLLSLGKPFDDEILISSFDLNGLKQVNDGLGHAMGDEYIKSAGAALLSSFSSVGNVFRVGGDEFSVLMFGRDVEKQYLNSLNRLFELEEAYNKNNADNSVNMQFAYGHSVWKYGDDRTLAQVEVDADNAMYEKKRQMKEQAAANIEF
ncbi:GGDEF domain-containing protein [Butyrivibrio sp. MC2013]|uniref:GGDEF domain-containing protein n=1 Tax=Butyrivibrio sp. MC2013 TaxID=1280686 RepID=UPI000479E02C|nr:GGDEF domain-containing protein [Butyrivibrio sp. MC2013]